MNSHHAIVCIADTLENSSVFDVYKTQSSDVTHITVDRFSIDDARQLSVDALQKPIDSEHRVFVIVTSKLPEESQNALLKLFEEPPAQTRFVLVLPNEGILIPTLRSRVMIENTPNNLPKTNETFSTFLADTYAKRIATVADMTKKKDLQAIEDIIHGAEKYASKDTRKYSQLLSTVLFVRGYAKTPGASVKMLLEELALVLPVIH